jgi:hypothetical protein
VRRHARPISPSVPAVACATGALALAGCGNHRAKPIDLSRAQAPAGMHPAAFPTAGLRLRAPVNWKNSGGATPLVQIYHSGNATIAIWRYPRREQLPKDAVSLARARRSLIDAARARDRSLKLRSSKATRVAGEPAVELVATERVGSGVRMVRSTHVYAHGGEVVVDAYSPPSEFGVLDRTAFRPLVSSLRISAPR